MTATSPIRFRTETETVIKRFQNQVGDHCNRPSLAASAGEKTRRDYPRSPDEWLGSKHAQCLLDIKEISEHLHRASEGDEAVFLLRQARGAYAQLDHIRRLRSAMPCAEECAAPEHPDYLSFRKAYLAHIEFVSAPPLYALEQLRAA